MIISSNMQNILIAYKSMSKTEKSKLKRSYISMFNSSGPTFARRVEEEFKTLNCAEQIWISKETGIPVHNLYKEPENK